MLCGRYAVTGPGARGWLDGLLAGRLPQEGRLALSPMLAPSGRLIGDFTVACVGRDSFHLVGSFGMQATRRVRKAAGGRHAHCGAPHARPRRVQAAHTRHFEGLMPADGSVRLQNLSARRLGFQIAGPRARELLARVTRADVSDAALPFLSARTLEVGLCDALVQRVSYTGDLGYEIYVPAEQQVALYGALAAAGADLGLRPFGMRAMMSLRLEKGFGGWGREYSHRT
jgi:dimethylglycine dehydrogenase